MLSHLSNHCIVRIEFLKSETGEYICEKIPRWTAVWVTQCYYPSNRSRTRGRIRPTVSGGVSPIHLWLSLNYHRLRSVNHVIVMGTLVSVGWVLERLNDSFFFHPVFVNPMVERMPQSRHWLDFLIKVWCTTYLYPLVPLFTNHFLHPRLGTNTIGCLIEGGHNDMENQNFLKTIVI